jgi:fermentation-respiration switch protein FrsA (DUF1100 family)
VTDHNIIIFGRSIGSGPATYVASHRNPAALLMVSGFTSIKQVTKEQKGIGCLSFMVKEQFDNLKLIDNVQCPTFFLHGLQDKLISY